ncbi:hypothetical protein B9479_004358 [Cryptococcus floricola]|uniref:Zn(2)-C6 fungal-type domain-containing protein n=1 Tax=Cryptococcus floricola TaxID=2591691 RepID=A0A5D3AYL7_9TREE|nr:hypothetical protein B9479_004358 [Cryptococcus floricola]
MGGDHKCPLCSATFTRPQHVGRHLRAHTGDRPYACKECPLKFARSDLLSRHVNKAHRSPDAGPVDKKPAKKGRRKSVPASAHSSLDRDQIIAEQQQRQQQQDYQHQQALQQQQQAHAQQQQQAARERSRSESHVIQQPQLQAQRMYPHHPLLAVHPVPPAQPGVPQESWNANPSGSVGTFGMMTMSPQPTYGQSVGRPMPVNPPVHSATYPLQPAFDLPFTAQPLNMSGSMDQQIPSQSMYEWDTKKRACDQCNHSKVRCDFADPCLRCKQRNLTCSYRKPQRPSSYMGPPLPPAQVVPFPSSSPSNMSISPHSSTQPSPQFTQMQMPSIAPTEPVVYRKPSVSSLPPNVGNVPNPNPSPVMSHGPAHGIGGWGSFPQTTVGGTWPPNMVAQQSLSFADTTAPGSITGQAYNTSPNSLDVPLPAPASPIPPNANASGKISPGRMGLLQTPSLVSNTDSPSEMDEPVEGRGSHNSAISATSTSAPALFWTKGKGPEGTLGFQPNMPNIHTHQDISPSHSQSQLPFLAGSGSQLNDPQGQQQWHMRDSFSRSDDTSSILSSSVTSSCIFDSNSSVSGASAGHQPGHARRRSSQTAWAHALEQMTLEESQKQAFAARMRQGSESAVSVHSELSPEGGRQPAQLQPEGQQIMPTLSDVKDLWKVFMSEPMDLTGLAPVAEGDGSGMDLDLTHEIAPRPGLGKRTLSKSNSMPDLQSPMINGPNFFSTFLNGMTPKASEAHAPQSYIGVQVPSEQGHGQGQQEGGGSIPDIGSWKDQIQQRQSSFSLGAPGSRLGKSKSKGSQSALPLDAAVPLPSRPMPSVVQRTALDQTLAPERIPSFGLTPGLEMSTNPHLASKLSQSTTPAFAASAEARAGSKRMASSSLANDHGKRASFSVWGGEEPVAGDEDVQDPATGEPLYAGARDKVPLAGQQQGLVQGWAAA